MSYHHKLSKQYTSQSTLMIIYVINTVMNENLCSESNHKNVHGLRKITIVYGNILLMQIELMILSL